VVKFISCLLQPEFAQKVLNSRPENLSHEQTLEEAFQNAHVHFTHFGRTNSPNILHNGAALGAMCRGMAWTFHRRQRGVDIGIPVFMGSTTTPHTAHDMTMIFIQVKNTVEPKSLVIDVESPDINFFRASPNGEQKNHPYITIVLNLGVQARNTPLTPSKLTLGKAPERPQPVRAAKILSIKKHPRYAFSVNGCSQRVYRVIDSPGDKNTYAQLLASRQMINEHPRADVPKSVNLIKNLKPYWDEGSYWDWYSAKDPRMFNPQHGVDDEEMSEDCVHVEEWRGEPHADH